MTASSDAREGQDRNRMGRKRAVPVAIEVTVIQAPSPASSARRPSRSTKLIKIKKHTLINE
jgi:hypothetical protein